MKLNLGPHEVYHLLQEEIRKRKALEARVEELEEILRDNKIKKRTKLPFPGLPG